jgi:hypothetical protein
VDAGICGRVAGGSQRRQHLQMVHLCLDIMQKADQKQDLKQTCNNALSLVISQATEVISIDLAAVCCEVSSSSGPQGFFMKDFCLLELEPTWKLEEALKGADDRPAIDDGVETTNW